MFKVQRWFYGIFALLGLILWPSLAAAWPLTASQQLQQSWHLAHEMGTYQYKTQLLQTTHPTDKLSNVGRSSKTQSLAFEGMMDKPNETLYLKMTGQQGQQPLEMKVENGVAYGRVKATAAWQPIEDEEITSLFAPHGDMFSYLNAAENVQAGVSRPQTDAGTLPLTFYSFDINGPKYADLMRAQMEAELARAGQLPAGVTLGTAKVYQTMRGHGEIWLNQQGLPVHQVLHLEFPPDKAALNWVSAKITTDFSDWEKGLGLENQLLISWARFRQNPTDLLWNPLALLPQPYTPQRQTLPQIAVLVSLCSLLIGFLWLTVIYRQSQKLYAALSLSVIFSMLVTPLMQGQHVQAFNERQTVKQEKFTTQQTQQQQLEQYQNEVSGRNFNPQQNPRQKAPREVIKPEPRAQTRALNTTSSSSDCSSSTDSDSDGLNDNVECYELGTWTDEADTDGDYISDYAEVTGFTDNYGTTWYLDPLNPDSNGDGLTDSAECGELLDISSTGTKTSGFSYSDCADTDGDKIPDVFDYDNDEDGVPDNADSSPDYVGSLTSSSQSQVNLAITGYDTSTVRSLVVDFELRPTVYEHLYQTNNVLDWPSGDDEGQITRIYDTTFNDEGYSDTKTDNGDMMLIPMLEIEIPAPDSNSANPSGGLPILSTYTGSITNGTDLDTWLDTETLDEYGITVSQDEDDYKIYVYIPLQQVEDSVGDTPVAWAGEMYYQPTKSSWGSNHQVRMVWMVNMLLESCSAPDGEDYDTYCDKDSGNWTTSTEVIQTYYEDFYLTSLNVREDYGFKVAVIAQTDALSVKYENYLWALGNDLQATFGSGLLLNSTTRFDITEIVNRFDKGTSTYSTGSSKLWGIPANMFEISSASYDDQITGLAAMVDTLIPNLLASTYSSATASSNIVTLLIAREEAYKSVTLGDSTAINDGTAHTISVNLTSLDQQTFATLNWSPYQYDGSSWSGYDLEDYLSVLETQLDSVVTNSNLTTLLTYFGETAADFDLSQAGVISLAKNYYSTLYVGNTALVKPSSTTYATSELVDDSDYSLDYNNDGTADEVVMGIVAAAAASLQDFFLDEGDDTLDEINEILEVTGSVDLSWDDDGVDYSYVSGIGGGIGSFTKKVYKYFAKTSGYGLKVKGIKVSQLVTGINLLAGALAVVQYFTGSESDGFTYSIASLKIVAGILDVIDSVAVLKTYQAAKAAVAVADIAGTAKTLTNITKSTKVSAFISLAVDIGVAITIFVLTVKNVKVGSLSFNEALADFIAAIIVAIIIAIISATVVGALIMAIVGLIDAVITLICEAVGVKEGSAVDTWVCGGITGAFTEALTYLIYDQAPIVDLTDSSRLDMSLNTPSVDSGSSSSQEGFVVGNQLSLSAIITTTISMNDPTGLGSSYASLLGSFFTNSNLQKSAFSYALESSEVNHHSSLSQSSVTWSNNSHTFTPSGTFEFTTAGINEPTPLYLNESFNIPTLECWGFIAQYCSERANKDTYNYDMSDSFAFDILPSSFSEFIELDLVSDNSYRLRWDDEFPTFKDADGDGLISQAGGGSDPDDSNPDYDNDGLSDYWETLNGYDPETVDGDDDGLTDYWEEFYGTNSYTADSDGDGLEDGDEVFHPSKTYPYENSTLSQSSTAWSGGWTIVYDYNSSNTALKTRVTSDPLMTDEDSDDILDKAESVYGYNPNVAETLNVLSLNSAVKGATIVKSGTTIAYTATIKNELDSRYALGLLQAEFPVDTVKTTTVLDTLAPGDSVDMSGSVSTSNLTSSQATSLTLRAGAEIEDLTTDYYLWLNLNESAGSTTFADDSLLGHDATCTSCPTANGNYLIFSSGNYLQVPYDDDFNDTTFSLSFSLKRTTNSGTKATIFQGEDYHVYLLNKQVFVDFDTYPYKTVNTDEVTANEWTNIFLTVSSSEALLYVNGVQVDSASNPKFTSDNDPLYIGKYLGGFYSFSGGLDDLRLYNYTLSASEVQDLAGSPVLELDLTELNDESSYGNTLSCTSSYCPTTSSDGAYFNQKSYLTLSGDNLDLSDGKFSFITWINPKARSYKFDTQAIAQTFTFKDSSSDWQGVFGNEDIGAEDTNNDYTSVSVNYPSLYVNSSGYLLIRFGGSSDLTSLCQYQTTSPVLSFNTWQQLAITFNGTIYTIYVNGVQVASGATNCSGKTPSSTTTFYVGRPNEVGYLYLDVINVEDFSDSFDETFKIKYDGDTIYSRNMKGTNNYNKVYLGEILADESEHTFKVYSEDFWGDEQGIGSRTIDQFDLTANSSSNSSNFDNDFWGYDSATVYWSVSNDYFTGYLDDFQVYNYALDADSIATLYDSYIFELTFDEAPGQDIFSDSSGNEQEANCDYSANTCPDSGLSGRDNQAVRFDGSNDYLTMSNPPQVTQYTQAAWIYPTMTDTNYRAIMGYQNGSSIYNRYPSMWVYNKTKISLGFGTGSAWYGFVSTDNVLTSNAWNHVAVTYDGSSFKLYVNGVLKQTSTIGSQTPYAASYLNIGLVNGEYFQGYIDEVVMLKTALSQSEIQSLMAEAPVLNLHLDEDLNTTTFADDTSYNNDATCTSCPQAGDDGQIREAAVFDGSDALKVADGTQFDLTTFSIGLWVKPTQEKSSFQTLINKQSNGRQFGMFINQGDLRVAYNMQASDCSSWIAQTSTNYLNEDDWNHLMMTYDGSTMSLYINGSLDSSASYSGSPCQNSADIELGSSLTGDLDEVTIYGTALSDDKVEAQYEYQAAWYDVTEQHGITIDADNPVVSLGLKTSYIQANPNKVMSIVAYDVTSSIEKVQYSTNNSTWTNATEDGDAWIFTYTPGSEGQKTLYVRAYDSVGNKGSASKTFTVDNTGPSISLASNLSSSVLAATTNTVTLNGQITDSRSGVTTNTVTVELFNHNGDAVSGGESGSVTKGNATWTNVYPFSASPYGKYSVQVTGQDAVGNSSTTTVGTVQLDGYGPVADTAMVSDTITATTDTLKGTVGDQPYPTAQRVAQFHFEESSGATQFADSSLNQMTATCTNCPTVTTSGKYGSALNFDGVNDYITFSDSDMLDLTSGNFTMMAWFNVSNYTGERYILQQANGTGTGRILLAVNTSGQVYTFLAGASLAGTSGISTNTWHHAALTYDGTTLRLYVDGVLQNSAAKTLEASNGDIIVGANKAFTGYFIGSIDEVAIYNTTLSAESIYDIANPLTTTLNSLKLRYRHASGSVWPGSDPDNLYLYAPLDTDSFEDLSTNGHDVSCSTYCPSSQATGKHGYAANFDGSNDYVTLGTESDFDGLSKFTLAAWIKVDSFSKSWQAILTKGDGAWRLQRYNATNTLDFGTLGLSNQDLQGSTNVNDGEWHHVAAVYDGSKKYLYVDGKLDASATATGTLSTNNYDVQLGSNAQRSGRNFDGSIDEVVIYDRALSASEVTILAMTNPWQSVTLAQSSANYTTWSTPPPSTLQDGPYKLDAWVSDSLGNISYLPNIWSGAIDIQSPSLTFSYTNNGNNTAKVSCYATDQNLSTTSWSCPVGDTYRTTTYETATWYTNLTTVSQIIALSTTEQTVSSTLTSMTACDSYNHCTTASPGPNGVSSGLQLWLRAGAGTNTTTNNGSVTQWADQAGRAYVATQTTTSNQPTYLSNNVNGQPVIRFDGSNDDLAISKGLFVSGKVYSDVNIYLVARTNTIQNSMAFQESVSPQRVSVHIPWKDNNLVFWDAGNTSGNYRLSTAWSPAQTGTLYLWSFLYSTDSTALSHKQDIIRNGQTLISDTTASSFTGQSSPFAIASANGSNYFNGDIAELLVYTSALTLSQHNLIQSYLANKYGLTLSSTVSSRERMAEAAPPAATASRPALRKVSAPRSQLDSTWRNEACNLMGVDARLADQVLAISARQTAQKFYVGWDNVGLRLGWTGGNWQAQGDLFIYLDTQAGGSSQAYNPAPQDETTIFLPTNLQTNQTMTADYLIWVREADITQTTVITHDDGSLSTVIEDKHVGATLLHWNGSEWAEVAGTFDYQFTAPNTDLYLPFSLLGITNPASQTLGLVAFATEENRLRLWSSMPTANNLNSQRVIGQLASDAVESFMLLKQYQWDSLALGACPNGSLTPSSQRGARAASTVQFNGANITAKLTADPAGVNYNLFGNNLIFAHQQLFPQAVDWQAEYSELCQAWEANTPTQPTDSTVPPPAVCDRTLGSAPLDPYQTLTRLQSVAHPFVVNGQTITYRLEVSNDGTGTANQVMLLASSDGPLHLMEGQRVTAPNGTQHDEYRTALGTLAPGEQKTVVFHSQIDLNLATPTQPGQPSNKDWAKLMTRIYDETGDEFHPLEELHLDHEVDYTPPSYVEIEQPTALISSGQHTFQGFVVDQSPVPTLLLELNGQVTSCTDAQPTDPHWSCEVTLANLAEGATVRTRVKARDSHGFESNWFNGPTLMVDTIAPVITFSEATSTTFTDALVGPDDATLTGVLSDNRYANRVEVCTNALEPTVNCQPATVLVDPTTVPTTSYTYVDDPGSPIVIGKNNTCPNEQIRSFNVLEDFIIADLDIGLNIAHPVRNDVVAFIVAPNGQREEIYSRGSGDANLDVWLNDAAAIAVNKDFTDHDPAMPYYDHNRRPYGGSLYKFRGLSAKGTWILRLCDSFPNGDEGLYYRSQLSFRAATTPQNSQATWQYRFSWPDEAAQLPQAITVYGYDTQGHRSEPLNLNFTVDTQRPRLMVSETSPLTDSLAIAPLAATTQTNVLTLAGTVSDLFTPSLRLAMRTPNGDLKGTRIERIGETWHYTDTQPFTDNGLYCLWVEAWDTVKNRQRQGPYALQVEIISTSIPVDGTIGKTYLPLLLRTQGGAASQQVNGTYQIYLPIMTRGEGVVLPPEVDRPSSSRQVKFYFLDTALCR